ncbi:MAG: AMP-binding protein [Pseudomonadales bacterium]|nr:AMP-binding protein [Pseudomonadales bacterium]
MDCVIDQLFATPSGRTVLSDGTRQLGGSALATEVKFLAGRLRERQVRRLALWADNSLAWVIADLACQLLELPLLPLPPFFTAEQCAHVLRESGIDAVLSPTPEVLPAAYARQGEALLPGFHLYCHARLDVVPPLPPGTGKLTFTSGSTGTPKGVCLSNAQLLRQAQMLAEVVGLKSPRHLCVLPLSTLLENVAGIYAPLLAGGTVELRSMAELGMSGSRMTQPQRFLHTLSSVAPDTLILIPQLLQLLVHSVRAGWQPPPLRFIAVGGSRVSAALIHEARALGLPVYEGYGLSECASVVSLNAPGRDLPGSCGQALPHVRVRIEEGEVLIDGNAMLGYVNDHASWGQRTIHSGDLGRLDAAGFLHIEGRCKNLLISSYGRNIAPEWVESELLATAAFSEVVVFGDARPWCVALVSPSTEGIDATLMQGAIAAANARLPDYAQVRQWLSLPRRLASQGLCTANGRPRRSEIELAYAAELENLYTDR